MVIGAVTLTGRGHARTYAARERRRGHHDPARGLFRTHRYVSGDSGFDVGDAFPDRDRPATFAVDVRRDTPSAQGIVFEAGDATTGLVIWVPMGGDDISASAGDAGDDGVTLTATDVLEADGQVARVVFAVIPGTGEARLWVNGEIRAAGVAVNGALPNGWASDSVAGIGEVQGTVSSRVPAADRITLVNASIVSTVDAFAGQRPRHFEAGVTSMPVVVTFKITEAGDFKVTEAGDFKVTEGSP